MDNLTSRQSVAAKSAVMPNLVPQDTKPSFTKIRNDLIRQPPQFLLDSRHTRGWGQLAREQSTPNGDLGLRFVSPKRIPASTKMALSAPLRGQKLHRTVMAARGIPDG